MAHPYPTPADIERLIRKAERFMDLATSDHEYQAWRQTVADLRVQLEALRRRAA